MAIYISRIIYIYIIKNEKLLSMWFDWIYRPIYVESICKQWTNIQYIPRNMHTVFALLCFVVVIHWLIFPYPSGLLHWHCGNLTIAPVPAKQPWWIWINTSCEFIIFDIIMTLSLRHMSVGAIVQPTGNDIQVTTRRNASKPCVSLYFVWYLQYTDLILNIKRRPWRRLPSRAT